jgi:hypothetical protein
VPAGNQVKFKNQCPAYSLFDATISINTAPDASPPEHLFVETGISYDLEKNEIHAERCKSERSRDEKER